MPDEPILQVALDVVNLHRALQIAAEAAIGGCDWLEAGTPLIKSEGLKSIRQLKKSFPSHTIVADMKTMDVGTVEVEIASNTCKCFKVSPIRIIVTEKPFFQF